MLIEMDARLLMVGSCKDGQIELYHLDDGQYLCLVNKRFAMVCADYDFDYRSLAETLDEEVTSISFACADFLLILADWLYVECDCQHFKDLAVEYFRKIEERRNK